MNTVTFHLPLADNYFITEAYKTLRANLLFSGADKKTYCFTSRDASEGKTTISLGTAYRLTELGKRVLYLDCDMRCSYVASRLTEGGVKHGLSEYLSGQCELEDVICATQYDGLHIILAGQYPPNPIELLSSSRMTELLSSLKERYDYVMLDTPPVGMVIDGAVVAPLCDGTVLVINAERNRLRDEKRVIDQLQKSGARILGAVVSHIRPKRRLLSRRKKNSQADETPKS